MASFREECERLTSEENAAAEYVLFKEKVVHYVDMLKRAWLEAAKEHECTKPTFVDVPISAKVPCDDNAVRSHFSGASSEELRWMFNLPGNYRVVIRWVDSHPEYKDWKGLCVTITKTAA